MDDSGADGLEEHEILRIPKVQISLELLKERPLQCSVCLEHLQANEEAKMLPCNHYFHERCIVPWLELRGTCPDCRRNLVPQSTNDDTEEFVIDEDEETLSGYESEYSSSITTYGPVVQEEPYTLDSEVGYFRVVESVNGNVYYEEIEDLPRYSIDLTESFSNDLTESFSSELTESFTTDLDTTRSPITSPISLSEDEDFIRYSKAPKRRWGDSSSP
uniref:RING-type domain-containing protein n=1 Tax=Lygus hesperus TaxID=30085 RepID=A0A0A9WBW4_LYGHE